MKKRRGQLYTEKTVSTLRRRYRRWVKKSRDSRKVELSLKDLYESFQNPESNCIYPMLKAVKAYATLGEIVEVDRQVFGEWREPSLL